MRWNELWRTCGNSTLHSITCVSSGLDLGKTAEASGKADRAVAVSKAPAEERGSLLERGDRGPNKSHGLLATLQPA